MCVLEAEGVEVFFTHSFIPTGGLQKRRAKGEVCHVCLWGCQGGLLPREGLASKIGFSWEESSLTEGIDESAYAGSGHKFGKNLGLLEKGNGEIRDELMGNVKLPCYSACAAWWDAKSLGVGPVI